MVGIQHGSGDPGLETPDLRDKAQRSLDFRTTAELHEAGFHIWYNIDERRWERIEVLSEDRLLRGSADGRSSIRAQNILPPGPFAASRTPPHYAERSLAKMASRLRPLQYVSGGPRKARPQFLRVRRATKSPSPVLPQFF